MAGTAWVLRASTSALQPPISMVLEDAPHSADSGTKPWSAI